MKLLLLFLGTVAVAENSQLLNEFTAGSARFAADVYKKLRQTQSDNFVVCPLSAEVILALAEEGAKGATSQQLSNALHLPKDKSKIKRIFQELTPYLQNDNIKSANKVYIKNGVEINKQFKNTALNDFDSEIQNINFKKNDEATSEINAWVADKTRDTIKNLISDDELDKSSSMVLVNAMIFNGNWLNSFNEDRTTKSSFHVDNSNQVDVDMMRIIRKFNFYENSNLKAKFLELPYEGEEITMTIVLPNDVEGLRALEDHIADVLVTPNYKREKVDVKIPKFKIETTIEFKSILKDLGVVNAFQDSADFSEIRNNKESLKISKVFQKAVIEVEEKGTTASAGSDVVGSSRPGSKKFVADHPFIYYLKSKSAGIMFVGRFVQG